MDAFEFITEGVANMFISGQKVGEDTDILHRVLKSIRQLNEALINNPESHDEEQPLNNTTANKPKPMHLSVLQEEAPQGHYISPTKSLLGSNVPSFNISRNQGGGESPSSNTTRVCSISRTTKNNSFQTKGTQCHQTNNCNNCLKLEIL
jgi:hypothetical protein